MALNDSQSFVYSGVEQLAARQAHNLEVVGSSPTPATKKESKDKPFFLLASLDIVQMFGKDFSYRR